MWLLKSKYPLLATPLSLKQHSSANAQKRKGDNDTNRAVFAVVTASRNLSDQVINMRLPVNPEVLLDLM